MNFIEVEKPHGFLIWKKKQTSIADNVLLPVDEKLYLVCNDEVYGEIVLDSPEELPIEKFDNEKSHCIKNYERKILWSDSESLFVHPIKEFIPYAEMKNCSIVDNELVIEESLELSDNQKSILEIAQELPNQILIDKNAVQITDDLQLIGDNEYVKNLLSIVYDDIKEYETKTDLALPLYNLMMVREPNLKFKENKEMPYEKIERGDETCVVNTETEEVEECYSGDDAEERADDLLAALQINVEDEESMDTEEKAGRRIKNSWLKKLEEFNDMLKEMLTWAKREDEEPKLLEGFSAFGIKEDTKYGDVFVAVSSNSFEDREGEIVSQNALKSYVRKNEENEIKGYFNLFHIPHTDFAEKRFQSIEGRFLIESGPFLNNQMGKQVKKFLKEYPKSHPKLAPEGWGMSIEYVYLPEQRATGVYNWIFINKTSLLPKSLAANVNTIGVIKMSDDKKLSPAQEHFVKEVLTEKLYNKLTDELLRETEELEKTENFKNLEEESEENPKEEVITEVETVEETESEEPTEEVETNEEVTTAEVEETVETPDLEKLMKQISDDVVTQLNENMKSELEIIATFPDAIDNLNKRIDGIEQLNAEKQASEQPRFSFFNDLMSKSVVKNEEANEITEEEVKEVAPKEVGTDGFIASRIKNGS